MGCCTVLELQVGLCVGNDPWNAIRGPRLIVAFVNSAHYNFKQVPRSRGDAPIMRNRNWCIYQVKSAPQVHSAVFNPGHEQPAGVVG